MDTVNPVLAKKLGDIPDTHEAEGGDASNSPMRMMRRALGRAAEEAMGLAASVLGIADNDCDAEALIDAASQDWVVLGLRDSTSAGLSGLFLMDPVLRSALVEMQTLGALLPLAAEQRPVTRTDAVLTVPFAEALLLELAEVGFGTEGLDPAAFDIGPMDDLRTAGLVMLQGRYLSWRVTIQLGGDIQGELLIAMRPYVPPVEEASGSSEAWAHDLRRAVEEAPAELDAIIARMSLPVDKIEAFETGQVLTLPGVTVGSVALTGPDDVVVAAARLGQVAGKRAVRVEQPEIEMQDDNAAMPAVPMGTLPMTDDPMAAAPMADMPIADMPMTDVGMEVEPVADASMMDMPVADNPMEPESAEEFPLEAAPMTEMAEAGDETEMPEMAFEMPMDLMTEEDAATG